MADSDLPVWSFRANWREPVSERLAFLTDVLRSSEGAEQRRCLRPTPRRTVEADFLLTGAERTFLDLFLNRLSGSDIMIPLYWDIASITTATVGGATTRLTFDNTYREFQPGLAILMGKSALDYEVVSITSMDTAGVNLAAAVARKWPKGSKLLPLRRGVLADIGEPSHSTGGIATVTSQFRFTAPSPWTPAVDTSPVYLGRPVFLDEPNWREALPVSYDREIVRLDPEVGIPYQADSLGRALLAQAHRWFLPGRQKLAGFRDLIYRHSGRAGSFWLPTFKHDLQLVNAVASGATQIEIENVGYGYTGGPTSGREYIAIKHGGGTILRKVLAAIPGTTSATEKLNLDAPVGLALSTGQVLRISFADVARFDQDEFEITHHAGIDGLSEVSASFRTFKATRTAPTPIHYPVPVGVKNSMPCGQWSPRAISFVLDRSGSMADVVSGGQTRMAILKAAMNLVLDTLAPFGDEYAMDINVTSFSTTNSTITRRSVGSSGIGDLKNFVNSMSATGGTNFEQGMIGAQNFFNGTSASITDRFLIFITDGIGDNAPQAQARLNSLSPIPASFGISIDQPDTATLALLDNTPQDGVPVLTGGDTNLIVDTVLGAFYGV